MSVAGGKKQQGQFGNDKSKTKDKKIQKQTLAFVHFFLFCLAHTKDNTERERERGKVHIFTDEYKEQKKLLDDEKKKTTNTLVFDVIQKR
jgi:hypothetical protein